jgi:hypothetical protein
MVEHVRPHFGATTPRKWTMQGSRSSQMRAARRPKTITETIRPVPNNVSPEGGFDDQSSWCAPSVIGARKMLSVAGPLAVDGDGAQLSTFWGTFAAASAGPTFPV